jgi:hypothetical protein
MLAPNPAWRIIIASAGHNPITCRAVDRQFVNPPVTGDDPELSHGILL